METSLPPHCHLVGGKCPRTPFLTICYAKIIAILAFAIRKCYQSANLLYENATKIFWIFILFNFVRLKKYKNASNFELCYTKIIPKTKIAIKMLSWQFAYKTRRKTVAIQKCYLFWKCYTKMLSMSGFAITMIAKGKVTRKIFLRVPSQILRYVSL